MEAVPELNPVKEIVPLEVMPVAPAMVPVLVIPPLLLFNPPLTDAPPAVTVNPPEEIVVAPPMVCPTVKLLFWFLYATLVSVPAVLMSVPFNLMADSALTVLTAKVALVPSSVKLRRVFGTDSAS